jgi:hypothetical protein
LNFTGGDARFFNLQCSHPRALFARQDRICQKGVHENAEIWAYTGWQDEVIHASEYLLVWVLLFHKQFFYYLLLDGNFVVTTVIGSGVVMECIA